MLSLIRNLGVVCSLTALASACGPSQEADGGGGGGDDSVDARPGGPNEFSDAMPAQRCSKMDNLVRHR